MARRVTALQQLQELMRGLAVQMAPWLITNRKIRLFIVTLSGLIIVVVLGWRYHHHDHTISNIKNNRVVYSHSQHKNQLTAQLNDISNKLSKINQNLDEPKQIIDLEPIRAEIAALALQTQKASQQSKSILIKQINLATATLERRLIQFNQVLKHLKNKQDEQHLVMPSSLPFKIISVDNIQAQYVVTVRYNHNMFPMMLGDQLAGWHLVNASFTKQNAEFVNKKHQHTIVTQNDFSGI